MFWTPIPPSLVNPYLEEEKKKKKTKKNKRKNKNELSTTSTGEKKPGQNVPMKTSLSTIEKKVIEITIPPDTHEERRDSYSSESSGSSIIITTTVHADGEPYRQSSPSIQVETVPCEEPPKTEEQKEEPLSHDESHPVEGEDRTNEEETNNVTVPIHNERVESSNNISSPQGVNSEEQHSSQKETGSVGISGEEAQS